jgi:hypothetical protein
MSSSVGSGNARVNVTEYVENPEKYGIDVMELSERYVSDPQFRDEIGYWRASIQAQRMFAEELNAKASARDYAALLKKISSGELGSDYANFLVRRAIEWPMIYLVNQELFSSVGYKSGSLPGVLNSAYYATRLEDGAQVVVVLFFHDLPMSTYRQWRRTLPHDEFARWLLSDPGAIETFRMWMSEN